MIYRDKETLQSQVRIWKKAGERIGLVPTMGALHDGHLSLVQQAQSCCDRVIVSIFVNPRQFNSSADLQAYPRTEAQDIALLGDVDGIFIPSVTLMYPNGFSSTVHVSGLAERLEGEHRPGHFDGMATVVTKLFGLSQADEAFFGEKDWQQLQIVRRFVQDLNLPVSITPCPTCREPDGLALSSRNQRLSPEARYIAPRLHETMQHAAASIRKGDAQAEVMSAAEQKLRYYGFSSVDYIICCDAETFEPADYGNTPLRLLAAATLDSVRLIDNIVI